MELLLEDKEGSSVRAAFWRNPTQWFREKNLGRGFWIFFVAAFFFDAGFSVYFFLFNLYLLDFHFNEKAIGLVNGALTLGALVGTLPVGALGRRIGLRPVLIFCFVAAPLAGIARAFWMWEPAQIGLAFLAGMVMSTWTVSFLPAVASLTTERTAPRPSASFFLSASVRVRWVARCVDTCRNGCGWQDSQCSRRR